MASPVRAGAAPAGAADEAPRRRHSIFSFIAKADDVWTRNVRALASEAELITLDPRPPAIWTRHASEFLIEQLASVPAVQSAVMQMTRAVEARGAVARAPASIRDGAIVIHPGSGGDRKCWPKHRFVELLERLIAAGKRVRVVLGEVESENWSPAEIAPFERLTEVVRPTRLIELFHVLGTATAVVANDSGPAHLAGIACVPVVVLFGPTDPSVWPARTGNSCYSRRTHRDDRGSTGI